MLYTFDFVAAPLEYNLVVTLDDFKSAYESVLRENKGRHCAVA